ncbi:unnamed protein product [Cuscuta campestris]|uniref:F-box domain-containing protein n=1 Tax=Cuscuta campestris TaxID=132261 RepID=A0A484NHN6_9ASTE|nr:unnamed protein product [Cuscuta campestris]
MPCEEEMCVHFPVEIILQILRRLPVKSAVKCTAVCKTWYALIKDPAFVLTHLQAASFSSDLLLLRFATGKREFYQLRRDNDAFEEYKQFHLPFECGGFGAFRLVGTCNGLICLGDVYQDYCNIILWNPSIHKHFILPKPDFPFKSFCDSTLGFGFEPLSNDYKVLLIVAQDNKEELIEVWLFSLNMCSWTRLSEASPKHCLHAHREAAFVKGALHWIGHSNLKYWMFSHMVLAFDLSTEKFFVVNFPKTLVHFVPQMSLIKYEESIAVVAHGSFEDLDDNQLELWVMKEYGVDSSWTKVLHSIGEDGKLVFYSDLIDVFGVRKNGEVLLKVREECGKNYELATLDLNCDQQKQQLKRLGIRIDLNYSFVGNFVESLVLFDKGEQDAEGEV